MYYQGLPLASPESDGPSGRASTRTMTVKPFQPQFLPRPLQLCPLRNPRTAPNGNSMNDIPLPEPGQRALIPRARKTISRYPANKNRSELKCTLREGSIVKPFSAAFSPDASCRFLDREACAVQASLRFPNPRISQRRPLSHPPQSRSVQAIAGHEAGPGWVRRSPLGNVGNSTD